MLPHNQQQHDVQPMKSNTSPSACEEHQKALAAAADNNNISDDGETPTASGAAATTTFQQQQLLHGSIDDGGGGDDRQLQQPQFKRVKLSHGHHHQQQPQDSSAGFEAAAAARSRNNLGSIVPSLLIGSLPLPSQTQQAQNQTTRAPAESLLQAAAEATAAEAPAFNVRENASFPPSEVLLHQQQQHHHFHHHHHQANANAASDQQSLSALPAANNTTDSTGAETTTAETPYAPQPSDPHHAVMMQQLIASQQLLQQQQQAAAASIAAGVPSPWGSTHATTTPADGGGGSGGDIATAADAAGATNNQDLASQYLRLQALMSSSTQGGGSGDGGGSSIMMANPALATGLNPMGMGIQAQLTGTSPALLQALLVQSGISNPLLAATAAATTSFGHHQATPTLLGYPTPTASATAVGVIMGDTGQQGFGIPNFHQQQNLLLSMAHQQGQGGLGLQTSAGGSSGGAGAATATVVVKGADGIPLSLPATLAHPEDCLKLSHHQVFLRHQIDAFEANEDDITTHTRGRNKPIALGQVGIRCRHCAHLPVARRQKGSTYFPASLMGLYQAAQNMSTTHMQCGLCTEMPVAVKQQFGNLMASKTASSGAGRPYWAKSAEKLGLVDTEDGIRFVRNLPPGASIIKPGERGSTTATSSSTGSSNY